MLLRIHSSKSRPDIKQRKSTSPARPGGVHLEHIDVEHARRDAQTAATEAFVRSQQRSDTADTPLFPDSAPKHATSTREGLRRQQSVRFVADADDNSDAERPESRRSLTRSAFGASRFSKCQGDVRGKENIKPPHEGDVSLPEKIVASYPLTNIGLRRSKSMASGVGGLGPARPQRASSVRRPGQARALSRSNSPVSSSAQRCSETNDSSTLSLRVPKSMSFLRSSRRENSQNESVVSSAPSHKEPTTHAEAESDYSQRTTISRRLRAAPSMLFRSGSVRSIGFGRRSMRLSMRDGLDKTMNSTASGGRVGSWQSRDSTLTGKARKASQGLKSRIMTLFSRDNKEIGNLGGFEQATDADHQQNATPNQGGSIRTNLSLGVESMREDGTLSQVSSRVPTVQTMVQDQLIRSRRGSLASVQSECRVTASDDASRATSWGSSGHSTVASQQQAWSDWQQQRLSVITENAAGVASLSSPEDANAVGDESAEDRRVYSALAKRLAERQQLAGAGFRASDDAIITQQVNKGTRVGTPNGDVYPALGDPEGGTIRCVTASKESVEHCQVQVPENSKPASPAKMVNRWTASVSSLESTASAVKPRLLEARCSTPDLPSLGMPRSNRSSGFFGSPSYYLFRTASPYRRALKESNKAALAAAATTAQATQSFPLANSVESLELPSSILPGQSWVADENAEYSESVYSGDDNSEQVKISESQIAGDVENWEDGSFEETNIARRLSRRTLGTSSESVDWKTWLAANVSKLEIQSSPVHGNGYISPNMEHPSHQGHRREATQIYDDGDDDGVDEDDNKERAEQRVSVQAENTTAADEMETTPLGVVQHNITRASSYHGEVKPGTLVENQAPRTPTLAKSGLARARSLYRTRTSADGSPCRPQAPASVKLVRRSAAADTASPKKTTLDDRAQHIVARAESGPDKATATASRRMVDLFLSNRRRRMASSKNANDAFV